MFIQLGNALATAGKKAEDVFSLHPLQIMAYLDVLWEAGRNASPGVAPQQPNAGLGGAAQAGTGSIRDDLLRALQGSYKDFSGGPSYDLGGSLFADIVTQHLTTLPIKPEMGRYWDHLIYAYCIENTRVYEICQKVLVELIHGERLGTLSPQGHRWVRSTEELFFRDSVPSLIASLVSSIRPDIRATRRNAYYRMFAMDLNHGTEDNRPYSYHKGDLSNQDFVVTLEALLREIWRGYINASNTSGANTTDNAVIAELCRKLYDMMSERRRNGALSREEFVAVAAMSWFHLTLSANTPLLVDLKADASTPEERLRRLGERVGVGSHSRSRAFFSLAEPLSRVLSRVEKGEFNSPLAVDILYDPTNGLNITADTLNIIHHWSTATGRDLKATPVAPRAR